MEFRAADGAVWLLRTALLIGAAVAAVLLWLPSLLWAGWPKVSVVIPFVFLLPCWWYAARLIASVYGNVTARAVHLRYGVLWIREIFVPMEALRTFEVWTPPLHRIFRCRTVVLRFAGGAALVPLLGIQAATQFTQVLETLEEDA